MKNLIKALYAHTTMTLDDIMYVAKSNGILVGLNTEGKMTTKKGNEEITFDVTCDNGLIYIFDI